MQKNFPYNMETHLEMRNQASESAEVLYEYIADWIAPKSVVDVGCGNGAWLKAWKIIVDYCPRIIFTYVIYAKSKFLTLCY